MTETKAPNFKRKIRATHIIIAILVVVALLQSIALIQQGNRQAALEKQQQQINRQAPPRQPLQRFPSKTHLPTAPSQALPRSPFSSMMGQDPWDEFDAVSRRMNSLMRQAFMFASPLMQTTRSMDHFDFTPAVDLEETTEAYIVRSDLPGLEKDKINLTVRDNILTIEGIRQSLSEKEDAASGYYAQERSYGSFARSLQLPGPVDDAKITADYKNGVLTITLPKAGGQKAVQKVPIQ